MFSFAKKLVDRFDGGESTDNYFRDALTVNNKGYGLRVLQVTPHSAGQQVGLESWFDYIVRINHHELPMQYPALSSYSYGIQEDGTIHYGDGISQEQASLVNFDLIHQELTSIAKTAKEVVIDVWSSKGGVIRQVVLPLHPKSNEASSFLGPDFESLGLTLQSQHLNTATYVWRILATHPGSPAFQASLVPHADYIIGCDSAFPDDPNGRGLLATGGEAHLSRTILQYYNRNFRQTGGDDCVPITLYVYNHDFDILRPVTVNLTRSWGNGQNKGILGCDVGYGLLHRLPEVVGKFAGDQIVDDLVFESNETVGYQIPAQVAPSPSGNSFTPMAPNAPLPAAAAPPRGGARKKKHVNGTDLGELSGYMDEELQKSKEKDAQYGSAAPSSSVPPPPPKAT